MQDRITVIYIISDRRSGSTLLENVLSKSSEIVAAGELAMLKDHIFNEGPGELWNWNCSCGKPVMQCEFWSAVLANIYDASFETKIYWPYQSLKALSASVLPVNTKAILHKLVHTKKNIETIKTLNAVYISIAKVSNKKIIIDSSKDPMQALAINECENVDAKFILLSRDLRAITFSKLNRWKINKRSDKGKLETIVDSFFYKKVCEATFKCISETNTFKISYEALATNPQQELDKICAKFGLQKLIAPKYMELSNDHTIAGTPGRFEKKLITADDEWKHFYTNRAMLNILGKFFNVLS